jgi:hypothetical protein
MLYDVLPSSGYSFRIKFFQLFSCKLEILFFEYAHVTAILFLDVFFLSSDLFLSLDVSYKVIEMRLSVVKHISEGNQGGPGYRPPKSSGHYKLMSPLKHLLIGFVLYFWRENFVIFSNNSQKRHKLLLNAVFILQNLLNDRPIFELLHFSFIPIH